MVVSSWLALIFADSIIQKVKRHFNYMNFTQIGSSIEQIQEELEFQPPVILTMEDTAVPNGIMNGHMKVHLESGKWSAAPSR